MPAPKRQAPDLIDVENMCAALGENFGVVVYFTARLRNGKMELIGKTHTTPYAQDAPVVHVALQNWPVQHPKDVYTAMYTIAFDLWCQHDGAGATAAKRGAPQKWDGRVETPRRRTAQ